MRVLVRSDGCAVGVAVVACALTAATTDIVAPTGAVKGSWHTSTGTGTAAASSNGPQRVCNAPNPCPWPQPFPRGYRQRYWRAAQARAPTAAPVVVVLDEHLSFNAEPHGGDGEGWATPTSASPCRVRAVAGRIVPRIYPAREFGESAQARARLRNAQASQLYSKRRCSCGRRPAFSTRVGLMCDKFEAIVPTCWTNDQRRSPHVRVRTQKSDDSF